MRRKIKGGYRETKWTVFLHKMGIKTRICFMVAPYHPPYNNWLAKALWNFKHPHKKW